MYFRKGLILDGEQWKAVLKSNQFVSLFKQTDRMVCLDFIVL